MDIRATRQINRVAQEARDIFGAYKAEYQSRRRLAFLQHMPPTKPIAFLPRTPGNDAEILTCEIAVYVMKWAEEPDASLPTVKHVIHRRQQILSDRPIIYPYAVHQRLEPSTPTPVPKHQTLSPQDVARHGRYVPAPPTAPPDRPQPRAAFEPLPPTTICSP